MKYTDSIAVHSADVGAPFTAKGTRGGETSSGMGGICKGPRKNREDLFLEVAYAGRPRFNSVLH